MAFKNSKDSRAYRRANRTRISLQQQKYRDKPENKEAKRQYDAERYQKRNTTAAARRVKRKAS